MRHTTSIAPQFYVTAPQSCPYLEGNVERKLFTALHGEHAQQLNDTLSKQGFRRSQNVLYRPSCAECMACFSARIDVASFKASRTQRRIQSKAKHLRRTVVSPWATEEQFELFRRYVSQRHAAGGMADMDIFEFSTMIEETPIKTRVVEYTRPGGPNDHNDPVVAACLTDVFDDGLSMVYSFYDPALSKLSLGTYMVLDHVNIARDAGLSYVYLGYWVPGSQNMGYKASFSGLEIYKGDKWQAIGDPAGHAGEANDLSLDLISEQVARINVSGRPL